MFDAASIGGVTRANGQLFGRDLRVGQADSDGALEVFVSVPTTSIAGARVMILDNTGSGLTGSSLIWQPAAVVTQGTLDRLNAEADAVAWESPYVPGSMTVTVKVGLDDWQAATQHVVGNYLVDGTSKTYGWYVDVVGGLIRFGWGDGTTATHTATSTTPVPAEDGTAMWLQVVFDPEPGTAAFGYRLADTGAFTTLGNTVNTGATTMANPTEPGFIGKTSSTGATGLEGDLFAVTVASDADPSVWEIDFTACAAPAQSCTQDGRTWSANAAVRDARPGVGGTLTTFSHDPASGGPHAVASRTTPQGSVSYSYDPVGNMVGDSTGTALGWDARNRLVSWSRGSEAYGFAYDASGERVTRSDGTLTTVFLGDLEIDSTGEARTHYTFNGQVVAVRTTTGATSTLEVVLTDHLGSPNVTYNPTTGQVTGTRLHRPYGDVRSETGVLPGGRGYTGQQQDPSGLIYYGARYYKPQLMTFISADTIIPDPASPIGLNRYAYVTDNPIRYTDPMGHGGVQLTPFVIGDSKNVDRGCVTIGGVRECDNGLMPNLQVIWDENVVRYNDIQKSDALIRAADWLAENPSVFVSIAAAGVCTYLGPAGAWRCFQASEVAVGAHALEYFVDSEGDRTGTLLIVVIGTAVSVVGLEFGERQVATLLPEIGPFSGFIVRQLLSLLKTLGYKAVERP